MAIHKTKEQHITGDGTSSILLAYLFTDLTVNILLYIYIIINMTNMVAYILTRSLSDCRQFGCKWLSCLLMKIIAYIYYVGLLSTYIIVT